jgi:hypothetical protein
MHIDGIHTIYTFIRSDAGSDLSSAIRGRYRQSNEFSDSKLMFPVYRLAAERRAGRTARHGNVDLVHFCFRMMKRWRALEGSHNANEGEAFDFIPCTSMSLLGRS